MQSSGILSRSGSSQRDVPGGDESLTDTELASLLRNINQLRRDEKNKLLACHSELETLDPKKM